MRIWLGAEGGFYGRVDQHSNIVDISGNAVTDSAVFNNAQGYRLALFAQDMLQRLFSNFSGVCRWIP